MEKKEEALTDRAFWLRYWESKTDLIQTVEDRNFFSELFAEIIQKEKTTTAIELGGFPGHFSIYLKKKYNLDIALFDFVIHEKLITQLLQRNELRRDELQTLEGDIFQYQPQQQWDLVFSLGLIEHFKDTQAIVHQHLAYVKPGGTLLLTIPNLRGLNGWIQKTFDPSNYSKHYLHLMDPVYLKSVVEKEGLEVQRAEYYGKFTTWLENRKEKSFFAKLTERFIWFSGKVITTIIPMRNRSFSPYIIVVAKKKA